MKRIGILTYFNYYNYGSMLQGYATQRALNKYLTPGSKAILINYRYQAPVERSAASKLLLRIRRLTNYLTSANEIITKLRYNHSMTLRNEYFDKFRNEYTEVTEVFYRDKAQLVANPPEFDIYVTGSDQTWSPKVSGGYKETPMFLDFARPGAMKCAYAPSLGTAILSRADKEILKNRIEDYEIISCREKRGQEILTQLLLRKVEKVLDPTLLLTGDEWREIARYPSMRKNSYILCYFLGDRKYYRRYAEQLSRQIGLPIYYIPVSWIDCRKNNNLIFDAGPREFIGWIDNAHTVLTDSFHGVAFCANLNKRFYAFTKHAGGMASGDNARLYDFLDSIGLAGRLLESYSGDDIRVDEIDYTAVNEKIARQRRASEDVVGRIAEMANIE